MDRDGKPVIGHIEDQILTHDGQTDETDIVLRHDDTILLN
jgi:hypothetical protein